MKRTLKFLGWISVSIFAIFILSTSLLNRFYPPQLFKNTISQKILTQTGYQVIFRGELAWTFFFHPGVQAENIQIINPTISENAQLAVVDKLAVNLKILPLFLGKIEMNDIHLVGAHIDFIIGKNGAKNWQLEKPEVVAIAQPTQSVQPTVVVSTKNIQPKKETKSEKPKTAINIATIRLEAIDVQWIDVKKNQRRYIQNANFHANSVNTLSYFPVALSGILSFQEDIAPLNITLALNLKINSDEKQYRAKDMQLDVFNKRKGVEMHSSLHGNLQLDLKNEMLQLEKIKGNLVTLPFTIDLNVAQFRKKPMLHGSLQLGAFDLKEWLKDIREDVPNIKETRNVKSTFIFSDHDGELHIALKATTEKLQVNRIFLSNVELIANYEDHFVNIDSLTAKGLDGAMAMNATIDLKKEKPEIFLKMDLQQINLHQFKIVNDLTLSGRTNLHVDVKMVGNAREMLLSNLNGQMQLEVEDGDLTNVATSFQKLTADFDILNGAFINHNLLIVGSSVQAEGSGYINLPAEHIDYQISSLLPVSKRISLNGALNQPTVVVS